ncbi:hypothetical protein DRN97_07520 [Methanosarcinales archaeon]|nr:MAG: hypothetical protein DRN97_07520 [Methanosarcinales archaeon]
MVRCDNLSSPIFLFGGDIMEISKIVEREMGELAVTVINVGADALGIEIYNEDGRDLSEDEEWLNDFLNRLYDYIHGGADTTERDWWAIDTGRAQMLLELNDILGIKISELEEKILEWLSNLF